MDEVTAREYIKDKELEAGLKVRNAIFPPLTPQQWEKGEPQTASIAYCGDKVIGFIPLSLRRFKIAPGVIIDTAFENSVGTSAEYRSQGVGSKMIGAAKEFLEGRADSLFVYRGGERSKGYNFYAKTGHYDLHYMRYFEKGHLQGECPEGIQISQGYKEVVDLGVEMFRIFQDTYSDYGGYRPRFPGYWEKALTGPIYDEIPQEFYFLSIREKDKLLGYLIAGMRIRDSQKDGRLNVLELATRDRDEDMAEELLKGAVALASKKGLKTVSALMGDYGPFVDVYKRSGFEPGPRSLNIMALPLSIQGIMERFWMDQFDLPGVELNIWTPQGEFCLLKPRGHTVKKVTCEMKEETLVRWIMGRLDFRAHIREGTITLVGGNRRIAHAMAEAIPFLHWVYHDIDNI